MTTTESALPLELERWVRELIGREHVTFTRHAARREGWVVEAEGGERYFLRIDREAMAGRPGPRSLRRETDVLQELSRLDFPSHRILGWNDTFCAALQTFEPGTDALATEPREVQDRVLMHFMELLATLHTYDIDEMTLPQVERPTTAAEHSLQELLAIEAADDHEQSICESDALAAFGKRWLINHAPETVERTSLLQGDTGPANFLYDPETARVTAVLDWEWAHFGDPLEDLANVWVRNYFAPSAGGDLTPYFRHYAQLTGITLDRTKLEYYRIHQLVRTVYGLGYTLRVPDWHGPVWLALAYSAIADLQTCEAMLAATGIQPDEGLSLDGGAEAAGSMHGIIAQQLQNLVLPHVNDNYARFVVEGNVALLEVLDRQEQSAARIEQAERDGLRGILGHEVTDLAAARTELISLISELRVADEEPVLRHLHEMARIKAALFAPLMAPWSGSSWATFEL